MNCNERAGNMNKRKLIDYFKPGNDKNVRKDVGSTVQNEPIIETTTSQDKEAVTIEEDKPFHHFTLVLTDVLEPLNCIFRAFRGTRWNVETYFFFTFSNNLENLALRFYLFKFLH